MTLPIWDQGKIVTISDFYSHNWSQYPIFTAFTLRTPYFLEMSMLLSARRGISMAPRPPFSLGVLTHARWLKWESVEQAITSQPISRNLREGKGKINQATLIIRNLSSNDPFTDNYQSVLCFWAM